MIYQGNQWPAQYRGKLLTLNLHGRRANVERLERTGSGFVGKREPDMLFASDLFFRGIDLSAGPDGSVYVIDWSDAGECHEHDGVHRNSGRIYRVSYGEAKPVPAMELTGREARLRAMWGRHTLGTTDDAMLRKRLADPAESVRTWAIRLLTDAWPLDTVAGVSRAESVQVPADLLAKFAEMARTDDSGLVRLALASTLQRLPTKLRPTLAAALLARGEDATDPNLPPLVWYGLIPLIQRDPLAVVSLAAEGKFPRVRQWSARRFSEIFTENPTPLDALLAATKTAPESTRREIVAGMTAGFAGVRKATPPPAWKTYPVALTDAAARAEVQALNVVFGDGRALGEVRKLALDGKAELTDRKAALRSLIAARPADLREVCEKLLGVRFLNSVALEGLTQFGDAEVGQRIAKAARSFHPSERPALVSALASRPEFASDLLDLVAAGTLMRDDISAAQARQIRGYNRAKLTARLGQVWGEVRESPADKAAFIAKLRADLTPANLASGNPSRGRALFATSCATCHKLYDAGGDIGPNLTGAGRKDLEYLLSNIADPSAVVTKDFQLTQFSLVDGRTISGVVTRETPQAVTVQTAEAKIVIPFGDIDARRQSSISLMPDGLLQPLSTEQVRDLIAYLMSDRQVKVPE